MMRLPRLLALSLLAALAFSACNRASPTSGTSVAASPAVVASPSPSPAPSLTPSPLPSIGVDPAVLHGLTIQVWQAYAGPAEVLFTNQVAQFNAENQWGIVVTASGYGDYTSLFDAMNSALDAGK